MKSSEYLLQLKVGEVIRSVRWNGTDPLVLDYPNGWVIEGTDNGFRVFDGTQANKEIKRKSSVEVAHVSWPDRLHIDLPNPSQGRNDRPMSVELIRLHPLKPAYSASHSTSTTNQRQQLFLFYGLRYFLVRYRPIGSNFTAHIGEHRIFSYSKTPEGYTITPLRETMKLKVPGEKKKTLEVGNSYNIPEKLFLNSTFILGVHWWRFQAVPLTGSLPPIETDEIEDDERESHRLNLSIQIFIALFAVLTVGAVLFRSPPEKPVLQTEVQIKQPKIIPIKPKVVEKKPEPPKIEKKIVQPKPAQQPKKKIAQSRPKPKKQLAKKAKAPAPPTKQASPKPSPPKSPLPPKQGIIAKKPTSPPPPNPNVQLMQSLNFLGTSSSKPQVQLPNNYDTVKNKKYDPKAVAVGGGSAQSVLNDMVNVNSDTSINTKSARSIAGSLQFGDSKGGGKGLNRVEGKVASKDLYNPSGGLGAGLGQGLSLSGEGSVSESEIERILAKYMSKFQFCYEKALLSNPGLGGNVDFNWTIATNGNTANPKVIKSEMKSAQLHTCIGDVLKTIKFPKPKGGEVIVKKTFTFSSATL